MSKLHLIAITGVNRVERPDHSVLVSDSLALSALDVENVSQSSTADRFFIFKGDFVEEMLRIQQLNIHHAFGNSINDSFRVLDYPHGGGTGRLTLNENETAQVQFSGENGVSGSNSYETIEAAFAFIATLHASDKYVLIGETSDNVTTVLVTRPSLWKDADGEFEGRMKHENKHNRTENDRI